MYNFLVKKELCDMLTNIFSNHVFKTNQWTPPPPPQRSNNPKSIISWKCRSLLHL